MTGKIALYDLDRTITKRPTYLSFLLHAAWRHQKWRLAFAPAIMLLLVFYIFRLIDRGRLKEMMQDMMLGGRLTPDRADDLAASFARKTLAENTYPQAIAQIEQDRAQGYQLVLATASYGFYAGEIARRLGFDVTIATRSVRDDDGRITPHIEGGNCYAANKLTMVRQWLEESECVREEVEIRFYSDSPSDRPLFDWADKPIATNPTTKLRAHAERNDWQVIAWG